MDKRYFSIITAILCLLLCTPFSIYAAGDDFGGSIDVGISKKLKKFTLSLDEEVRFQSNFTKFDRSSTTFEVSYKPIKYVKLGGAYDFMYSQYQTKKGNWKQEIRHRYYFFVTGNIDAGRFNFSLRERFQSTHRQSKDYQNPKMYLRSRLQVAYDIRKSPFEPYISAEMFNGLNKGDSGINRWRFQAGCSYSINKHHVLDLSYRYTTYADDGGDEENGHLIGLGYIFKF